MPKCFACGRSRTQLTKQQNITFHQFPSNPLVREKWFEFLRANCLDINNIKKYSLMCSSHFDPSSFIVKNSCTTLTKTAVPSIIIPRVSTLKKNTKSIFPEEKACLTITIPGNDVNKSLVMVSSSSTASERSPERSFTSDEDLSQFMESNMSYPNSPTSRSIENCSIQVYFSEICPEHVNCSKNKQPFKNLTTSHQQQH